MSFSMSKYISVNAIKIFQMDSCKINNKHVLKIMFFFRRQGNIHKVSIALILKRRAYQSRLENVKVCKSMIPNISSLLVRCPTKYMINRQKSVPQICHIAAETQPIVIMFILCCSVEQSGFA